VPFAIFWLTIIEKVENIGCPDQPIDTI